MPLPLNTRAELALLPSIRTPPRDHKTSLEDEEALVDAQHSLEKLTTRRFLNLSVAGTVYKLIQLTFMEPMQASTFETELAAIVRRFKARHHQSGLHALLHAIHAILNRHARPSFTPFTCP